VAAVPAVVEAEAAEAAGSCHFDKVHGFGLE
jgi:hypothetical protein